MFSLYLWRHHFRDVTTFGKFGAFQTNFKITIVRTVFRKSWSTSSFWGVRCLFFFKKLCSKKLQYKIKRNVVLQKKNKKLPRSRTSERASFASQPIKPSNLRKSSKASKPTKDGKSLFFWKESCLNKSTTKFFQKCNRDFCIHEFSISPPMRNSELEKFSNILPKVNLQRHIKYKSWFTNKTRPDPYLKIIHR